MCTAVLRLAFALVACALAPMSESACPNACSGRGACTTDGTDLCSCHTGFSGPDCSRQDCPLGPAWVGYASGPDAVHTVQAVCSNMGACDSTSGTCSCYSGFTGTACERMWCPGTPSCSAHGLCMSLRQAALGYDGFRLVNPPSAYTQWDADGIYGCVCDIGWYGADCSKKACPVGDDPLTAGVPEAQTLSCECGGACTGSLVVSYAGRTRAVLATAVAATAGETGAAGSGAGAGESLQSVLATLAPQTSFASVTYSSPGGPLCSSAPGNAATITFTLGAGNAPQLAAGTGTLASSLGLVMVTTATVTNGTAESVACSNRGICDTGAGACSCVAGYGASDGNGNAGSLPDCGYAANASLAAACPVAASSTSGGLALACGGRGVCSGAPSYACACYGGYTGAACEQVLCPLAPAWWDEPAAGSAHALVECAGRGLCTRWNGTCVCAAGFEGAACDRLSCPSTDTSTPCSGAGRCLQLRQLASAGTVQGAPVGSAAVQAINCTLATGSFVLTFQYAATVPLPFNAAPSALQAALAALLPVSFVQVSVAPASATTVCDPGGAVTALVTFTSPAATGPQPLLAASVVSGAGTVNVTHAIVGSLAGYGGVLGAAATWDADALQGCQCDGYPDYNKTSAAANAPPPWDAGGWTGPACSGRTCPYGSDPLAPSTGAFGALTPTVQSIFCGATSGAFTLTYRGATTAPLDAATAAEAGVQAALQELPSVGLVAVAVSAPANSPTVCAAGGVMSTVTFLTELGPLPLLAATGVGLAGGSGVATAVVAAGTGGNAECSSRGLCNRATGLCSCFAGFTSSDGFGGLGRRGDCGAVVSRGINIAVSP